MIYLPVLSAFPAFPVLALLLLFQPLRPLKPQKSPENAIYINIGIKFILKIFSKLFAGSKKVATFATAFEEKQRRKALKQRKCKVLEKKLRKNLQDQKSCLTFAIRSRHKTANFFKRFFDLLVIF